ncbi:hypothetical protein [Dickeya dianthicola]|uniref:hypothetical protein n=1 Tax=Dickeya dianthicola TaxID=204039 RepID=UPI001E2E1885|nr:hypothetical protein [Dickeya dianthicola]MCI4029602.1 hypothetical protein [Dickeya dianthicola]MCI4069542.1 hypothetical protein [Dickeya dianthicola]MCI4175514.1 hypothetical protein [Dickeya dianthicola]MCI4179691.1 hypothetical protein [Dickeya dianthicola]MCI4184294.1 hypothetical protein [Dickeya dianthicola]
MMRRTSISVFMLAFASFASTAATTITVDSQRNCLTAPSMDTLSGTSAKFSLEQGRYVLSLVSNSMNCTSSSSNSCPIDTVMVQGGFKNARWGVSVTSTPIVVDTTTSPFIAYISDDNCNDNIGQATLLIQKAN